LGTLSLVESIIKKKIPNTLDSIKILIIGFFTLYNLMYVAKRAIINILAAAENRNKVLTSIFIIA
jgi:histidinol phosphatase-like PHP family hydrolase